MSSKRTFWQWLIGREPAPPAIPPPAAKPLHLGSADEALLAKLVADLADGKRRGEIADAEVLCALDGLWTSLGRGSCQSVAFNDEPLGDVRVQLIRKDRFLADGDEIEVG